MNKILALFLLLAAFAAHAASPVTPVDLSNNPYTTTNPLPIGPTITSKTKLGYQQITSLSSATALTVPTGATYALIVPETQAVRWRDDGTNPTSTVGMTLAVGDALHYDGDLSAIKFIETSASAKLNVSYYK